MSQEKRHERLGIPPNLKMSEQMEYLLSQTKEPETQQMIRELIPRIKRLESNQQQHQEISTVEHLTQNNANQQKKT